MTDSFYYYGQGQCLTSRFVDLIRSEKKDTRNEDEIVSDIMSRAGLRFE